MRAMSNRLAWIKTFPSSEIGQLSNAIVLLDDFLRTTLWNDRRSGYGPYPADTADTYGVVCNYFNGRQSYKCRMRYKFAKMFKNHFGITLPFAS